MDAVEFDGRAEPALCDEFRRCATESGRAEVPGRQDEVLVQQRLVAFDEELLAVGVPDLDGGPVLGLGVRREVLALFPGICASAVRVRSGSSSPIQATLTSGFPS